MVFKSEDRSDALVDLDTQTSVDIIFSRMPEVKEVFIRVFNDCEEEDVKLLEKAISANRTQTIIDDTMDTLFDKEAAI